MQHEADVEPHQDVCLNCGRYFFWTPAVENANRALGVGSQRCIKCATLEAEPAPVDNDPYYYKEKFKWKWRGPDFNESGTTRAWLFPGGRICRELTISVADYDGDFASYSVKEGEHVHALANTGTMEEAFKIVFETVQRLASEC